MIETSLRHNNYFHDNAYLSSAEGQLDLQAHLYGQLDKCRNIVIPWLSDARPLDGASVLEIGCGTGSSTVAIAEQGATVTAVDILDSSLAVAKDRCRVYGLDVNFFNANATEVHEKFRGQNFDFIIFFASLEHLTNSERIPALRNTWDMLPKCGFLCVYDAPNRLWFYDHHTSRLPFYHWLPDDLAFLYSRFSPREPFCNRFREKNNQMELDFLRLGRGVSFHEFELAIKKAEDLDVISSMVLFLRKRSIVFRVLWKMLAESRYESFLVQVGPKIHRGFYQRTLDLIIRKD